MIQIQNVYTNHAVLKVQTFGMFAIKIRDGELNLIKATQTPFEFVNFLKGA